MLKLNLGSGTRLLPGWVNVDAFINGDLTHNLADFPWTWADNSVDVILASHILEHFDRATGRRFLQECYRVLVPDGILRIAVPDLDKFIDCHLSGDFEPLAGYQWTDLNYFMGGDGREKQKGQRHQYMYSFENLAYKLREICFRFAARVPANIYDTPDYAAISLYVEAHK